MIGFNSNIDSKNLNSTAVNLAFRFGMQTAKPFKVNEDYDFNKVDSKELEGNTWLTSLEIKGGSNKFIFNEVVISVTQERNIVSTPLQGRDGTIKEFISNGDFNISVTAGVIANDDKKEHSTDSDFVIPEDRYPKEELTRLGKLLMAKKSIEVHSDFLKIFGISSVVVSSFNLVQETHSNRQSLQIAMLSDEPYEIKQLQGDYVKVSK